MNIGKRINKHRAVRQHREEWYERALDRLMNGKGKVGDVTLRWTKLKSVR